MRKNRTDYQIIAWKDMRNGQSKLHYYTEGRLTLCGVQIPLNREYLHEGELCGRCLRIAGEGSEDGDAWQSSTSTPQVFHEL